MVKCVIISLLLSVGLASCQKEQVEPTDAPARTAQEAKARLMAQSKWTMDEIFLNSDLVYKRGQHSTDDDALGLEWCRFTENGILEMKFVDYPIEVFYYKLDEANNRLLISGYDTFEEVEEWVIKTGSVYTGKFEMELKDDTDLYRLKLVPVD